MSGCVWIMFGVVRLTSTSGSESAMKDSETTKNILYYYYLLHTQALFCNHGHECL
jgi:hypothetical protein